MANHGAIRLDDVRASYHGKLFSLKHSADLDNGSVVFVGDLVSGERERYNVAVADATNIVNDSLVLVTTPELTYLAGQTILDFYNVAGKTIRGHQLQAGDTVTLTNSMLTGTIAVDNFVFPVAGATKLDVEAAKPGTATRFLAKVIRTETIFGQPATVIRVLSN